MKSETDAKPFETERIDTVTATLVYACVVELAENDGELSDEFKDNAVLYARQLVNERKEAQRSFFRELAKAGSR